MTRAGFELPASVPLFPLPGHVFLPGLPTPYRIFEPRYRALVRDLVRLPPAGRWLAIPRLTPGFRPEDYAAAPPFDPVATLGRVIQIAPLPEGQFHVVVEGLLRVTLEELPSPHAYRLARPLPCLDEPAAGDGRAGHAERADALFQSLVTLARMLGPGARELAALASERDDEDDWLFSLGGVLLSDADARYRLLASRSAGERIDLLLERVAELLHLVGTKGPRRDLLPEG